MSISPIPNAIKIVIYALWLKKNTGFIKRFINSFDPKFTQIVEKIIYNYNPISNAIF